MNFLEEIYQEKNLDVSSPLKERKNDVKLTMWCELYLFALNMLNVVLTVYDKNL